MSVKWLRRVPRLRELDSVPPVMYPVSLLARFVRINAKAATRSEQTATMTPLVSAGYFFAHPMTTAEAMDYLTERNIDTHVVSPI